jgi:hypothetical protein
MADRKTTTHDREPVEGGRDKVNVPHAADEADPNPNRPGDPGGGPAARSKRADDAEQAHTPPRDESRETGDDDGDDRHTPRRTSM